MIYCYQREKAVLFWGSIPGSELRILGSLLVEAFSVIVIKLHTKQAPVHLFFLSAHIEANLKSGAKGLKI